MPEFNCVYCAMPLAGEAGRVAACVRCGKEQEVPRLPPFFFPFQEHELLWIREVTQAAQNAVGNLEGYRLDPAADAALRQIAEELPGRIRVLGSAESPELPQLAQDGYAMTCHGYLIGRAVLGTLDLQRDLRGATRYESVDAMARSLHAACELAREAENSPPQDGVSLFSLHDAVSRWTYFEMQDPRFRPWKEEIHRGIDHVIREGYLLAVVEESEYKRGIRRLQEEGAALPRSPSQPGRDRWSTAAPPPGGTVSGTGGDASRPVDAHMPCEIWTKDGQGRSIFYGFRFFSATGTEIPKQKHLKFGRRMKNGAVENRLDVEAFLEEHRSKLASVRMFRVSGPPLVFSDGAAGARPLREFYEMVAERPWAGMSAERFFQSWRAEG